MLEYGHRKFRTNYLLLFKISFPFHLYGIAHGILAAFIYWILDAKGFLPSGKVADVLNPITIGLGIKGLTNLNFYNIVSSHNKTDSASEDRIQMTPVGSKLIMDSIEKYCENLIENSHDHYLDAYIHKSIYTTLQKRHSEVIIKTIAKHLPYSTKKIIRIAFIKEVEQSILDGDGDMYFAMRLFVNQYGLSRFKRFVYQIEISSPIKSASTEKNPMPL